MAVRLFGRRGRAGRLGIALAALTGIFGMSAVNAGAAGASTCKSPDAVSLMDVISVDFTQLTIMQRDGIGQQYCINVQTQTVPSAGTIPAAVASGQVDAGYINSGALASAIQQNLNIRVLMPLEVATAENNGFFASASSGIKSVKDLAGKTVGLISLASAAQAALEMDLDKAGVNPSSVKIVAYPFPQMGAGILSGQINAGQLAEPFLSQTKAKGTISEVAPTYSVFGAHAPTTYYIVNGTWAATHQNLVNRLEQALAQSILKAIRYPNELRNLTQVQDPVLTPAVLAGQESPMFSIDPQFASLLTQWTDMQKVGILSTAPPKPYGAFIEPTPVAGASQNILWDTSPRQTVDGAKGKNDRIIGYLSGDHLIAGPGNDIVIAAGGNAKITAGSGNDIIVARTGKNVVQCGKGHDTVYATKKDKLIGCKKVKYTAAPQGLLKAFGYGAGGTFPN
jgi:NitT/TauT family transport system substrate-binding protein